MIKNDIFTWSESVADEVYGWVEGVFFKDITSIYHRLCDCLKDTDTLVAMSGHIDKMEIELIFEVNGNGVRVVLLFNNELSSRGLVVKYVVTSRVILTL